MKKVAIRKLNRTQLRKAATKETYITGKILLDFFGYDSIDQLVTSRRDPASKKVFLSEARLLSLVKSQSIYVERHQRKQRS